MITAIIDKLTFFSTSQLNPVSIKLKAAVSGGETFDKYACAVLKVITNCQLRIIGFEISVKARARAWGLLRLKNARLVSDDWYFVRLSSREPLAFGSEKECYIEADIGKIWNGYERLVDKAHFDREGRAVVNVRWIVGSGGVIPMMTMNEIILLKRDRKDKKIVTPLNKEEALQFMLANDFCNPHQLVRDRRKLELRKDFFREYFKQTSVHLVNTTGTPQETQQKIRGILAHA